jgi:hypothetical protein
LSEIPGVVPRGTPRRTVEPDPIAAFMGEFRKLSSRLDKLERSAPLRNASISGGNGLTIYDGGKMAIKGGGVFDVDGTVNVNGPTNLNGLTKITGTTSIDGTTTINGPAKITGTLELPAGIIGNDALTSPLKPAAIHADATNFPLAIGANAEKVRATITVPAGYTQALVLATVTMSNRNPLAVADDMYLACTINGESPGWSGQVTVGTGETGFITNSASTLAEGLGSTFYIAAKASSGNAAWAANVNATANVDAIVVFLR